jgi:hypothetical protein
MSKKVKKEGFNKYQDMTCNKKASPSASKKRKNWYKSYFEACLQLLKISRNDEVIKNLSV